MRSLSLLLLGVIVTLASVNPTIALRGKLPFDVLRSPSVSEADDYVPTLFSETDVTKPHPLPTANPPPPPTRSTGPAPPTPSISSSTAAPLPPATPVQLNLSWPYAPDTACPYATTIRLIGDTYYVVANRTVDDAYRSVVRRTTGQVEAALETIVGEKAWGKQEKVLKKYMKHVNRRYAVQAPTCAPNNASCIVVRGDKHDDDKHDDKHDGGHHGNGSGRKQLAKFYLRHAQCGACVQHNAWGIAPTSDNPIPSYQPVAVMKWCTLAQPKLQAELPPMEAGEALADWEGVCVPAEESCPSATVDMNVLSPSTCARDEPALKQSCSLCVLDGYQWTTSKRAVKGGDNYMGECVSSPSLAPSPHHNVLISTLDQCPSVTASMDTLQAYRTLAVAFTAFVAFTGLMLCCLCLRACCMARKARLARSGLSFSSVAVPVAAPVMVSVPSVSSSPSPSAPPAQGYPAAVAVAQEYSQPLLSQSGLNPPRFSAYPQLQAYRV